MTGDDQSCAIYIACDKCSGGALRNIQIDGARPALGRLGNGLGIIEMGGNAPGQIVDSWYVLPSHT